MIYVAIKKSLSKDSRIKQEEKRLREIFKNADENGTAINDGLIQRASYMRVTLEDWEEDINKNGVVEMFTQSVNTPAYEKERVVARLYNTMNKNYQSIIKQLSDLLPDDIKVVEADDGFADFITNRED